MSCRLVWFELTTCDWGTCLTVVIKPYKIDEIVKQIQERMNVT